MPVLVLLACAQWIVVSPQGKRVSDGLAHAPPAWGRCAVVAARPAPGAWAEPDPWFEPASFPDDSAFVAGLQWGLADVGAPAAWALATGGDVRLAVLDTGVDPAHADLQDGERLTAISSVVGGERDVADSLGHGTMVCGVMAARTNNDAGMAGMVAGAGARVLSVKITSGNGSAARASDLARAIVLACEWGARAINVSFASSARSSILRSALAWAAARGAIVVCGAGNTADEREQFPAAYAPSGLAVAVTASDSEGALTPFDTRGDWIDGAAPGVDIFSTWPTYPNAFGSPLRDYASSAGTSFAAPLVTGLAGLAVSIDSSLAAGDFRQLFRRTLRPPVGIADAPALLAALEPPYRMARGVAAAESWSEDGTETLHVRGSAFWRAAGAADGDFPARRYDVRATLRDAPPLDGAETWVRAVGDGGWRPGAVRDGEECWGEAIEGGEVLRTFVYWVDAAACDSCPPLGWMPRAPWEVALPWTRWGRVPPVAAEVRLAMVSALPARGEIAFRVAGPAGEGSVGIYDIRGRRVARLALHGGRATWRGENEAGRMAPAGVYFARSAGLVARFVWLR